MSQPYIQNHQKNKSNQIDQFSDPRWHDCDTNHKQKAKDCAHIQIEKKKAHFTCMQSRKVIFKS